jgi:hypothetical protein
MRHYYYHGLEEGRLGSENDFLQTYPNFDFEMYKKSYPDTSLLNNKISCIKLFIDSKKELPDIKQSKICLIYVYYERKNEQKNQTNLSFFIKYGLNKKKWLNLDITTLFVINGHQCEVVIPTVPDIHVLKEDNCSDYEGWYNGIKYFEELYNDKIYNKFDYLCLMNAGTCGPFFEEDINNHWLIPFYNKMVETDSVACSPYINNLPESHPVPGLHLSCHFTLLKISDYIIDLLINIKIPNTILKSEYFNTVLGYKKDKFDAINTGEYGLSRVLIENNFNVCSLYWNNENIPFLDYITNDNREEFYHKNNMELIKTIFIKNIWRVENNYASLPVLYDYCKEFIDNKLNMLELFKQKDNINYNLIDKNKNGINHFNNNYNWNSKKEYYSVYGKAEELIIFNNKYYYNNSCVIYAHFDKNNILADYVISSLKTFIILGYDILFYTASDSINNIDLSILPFQVNFVKNEFEGTDWKSWLKGLNFIKNNKINYDWIMLVNDSLLLPINGIENCKNSIENIRKNCDFWGHWESTEVRWHLIGTPIEFKYHLLEDVIHFISNTLLICKKQNDYIFNMETCFSQYLVDKNYKYNVIVSEKELNYQKNIHHCPSHNCFVIEQWINNKKAFAIKWKYCISYLSNNIVSKEFNYLTKFLYYGPNGTISSGERLGAFIPSRDFYNQKIMDE